MCDSVRARHSRYDGPTDAAGDLDRQAARSRRDEPSHREVAMRSYENEVRFYQQLAPDLPIRTPRRVPRRHRCGDGVASCCCSRTWRLRVQGDQLRGCTPDVAEVAVRELVGLHAPRWGDPASRRWNGSTATRPTGRAMLRVLLPTLWDGFRERYGSDLRPSVHRSRRRAVQSPRGVPRRRRPGRRRSCMATTGSTTFSSIDRRRRRRSPSSTGRRAPSGRAQPTWRTSSVRDCSRRTGGSAEEGLVRGYHERLLAAGVRRLQLGASAGTSTDSGRWAGLVMAVAASMLVERTARGDQMFLVDGEPPRPPCARSRRPCASRLTGRSVRSTRKPIAGGAPGV